MIFLLILFTLIEMNLRNYLIEEVRFAAGNDTERDVITLISKPMWAAWCREMGDPEDSKPTEWLGQGKTRRVFGSKTFLVDEDHFWVYIAHKDKVNLKELPVEYHHLTKSK